MSRKKHTILFLNENPIQKPFTRGSISGKELRLRSALNDIDEVHVISLPGTGVFNPKALERGPLEKKITVHHTIPWPYYLAAIPLFLYGLIHILRAKPKTIEAESPIISGVAATILGKLFKIPTIVEVRASYHELIKLRFPAVPLSLKQSLLTKVENFSLKNATAVIANSKDYQKQLKKQGIESTVINPGLQYAPKNPSRKKNKLFTIGYLGRLVPEKGVTLLLEAVTLLKEDPTVPPFQVEIAGEGPMRKELEEYVAKHNLQNMVQFSGWSHNYTALARWDILVNPNLVSHPLEMVNVEAAYMGVPVICFGNKDIPETVLHKVTGLICQDKTADNLKDSMKKIMAKNETTVSFSQKTSKFLSDYKFQTQIKNYRMLMKNVLVCK